MIRACFILDNLGSPAQVRFAPDQGEGRGNRHSLDMLRSILLLCFALLPFPPGSAGSAGRRAAPPPGGSASMPPQTFYARRNGELAWTGSPSAQANGRVAHSVLARAATDGLEPDRY